MPWRLLPVLSGISSSFSTGWGRSSWDHNDFSSWSIHMAFIIVFSNLWGIVFKEWRDTRLWTQILVLIAIVVLIISTGIIGYGNYLDLLLQRRSIAT
jgi:L-rhamnose-H+ transport protein